MTTENDGLAALGNLTQEADAANPDAATQEQERQQGEKVEAAEQGAKEWGLLMFTVGGLVSMVAPELKPVYTEDRCLNWGKHANQVAEKYGWNGPGIMPELALLGCTAGFMVPTVMVLREKMREVKEGKEAGLAGKLVLWWRARQAKKAGQAAQGAPSSEVASDGGH
jgi:hypothetical protein